jgi:Photosynthesis affected mutant 68
MTSQPPRESLPFEPKQKKKKTPKQPPVNPETVSTKTKTAKEDASLSAIPEVVSKRMVRRMALFSGIPTSLGVFSFLAFYWIVSRDVLELPTTAVLLVTLGCFGLGVVGLSYGLLSASWEEERMGSWLGWEEFGINFDRMTAAWRESRQKAKKIEPEK